jgi:hypothetical protein
MGAVEPAGKNAGSLHPPVRLRKLSAGALVCSGEKGGVPLTCSLRAIADCERWHWSDNSRTDHFSNARAARSCAPLMGSFGGQVSGHAFAAIDLVTKRGSRGVPRAFGDERMKPSHYEWNPQGGQPSTSAKRYPEPCRGVGRKPSGPSWQSPTLFAAFCSDQDNAALRHTECLSGGG